MRDPQKNRVYDWERHVVAPRCKQTVDIAHVQMFIDGVWLSEGLMHAPRVTMLPKNATRRRADANRMEIRFSEQSIPTWVIVHEMAHSLTNTVHESTEGHGADFMGMYMKLLDKVCKLPLAVTMFSLEHDNIEYNIGYMPKVGK